MITWLKLKAGIATNAKVAKAGPDGALVYLAALCQHVQHGRAGRIAAVRLEADVLRVEAVALVGALSVKRINAALHKCTAAGLLRLDGGDAVICGYDAESMPACVKCHKPNGDHRFSTCEECRRRRSKATEPEPDSTGRGMSPTCRAGQDRTGQDNSPQPPASGGRFAPRSRRRRDQAVSHVPNMPLGAASCGCVECVAFRERQDRGDGGAGPNLRAVQ